MKVSLCLILQFWFNARHLRFKCFNGKQKAKIGGGGANSKKRKRKAEERYERLVDHPKDVDRAIWASCFVPFED